MKVLVTDPIDAKALALLQSHGLDVTVKTSLSPDELIATIPYFDVLAIRSKTKVTQSVIDAATKLQLIVRAGVGLDNVDQDAAKKRHIVVANTPEATSLSVAEHTFALLFALMRSVPDAHISVSAGKWEKQAFLGEELFGKCLGLVGFGRIAREVDRRAQAFGMSVIVCDPFVDKNFTVNSQVTMMSYEDVLTKADILSLHLPFTPETKHMLNAKAFSQMKKGARLINCSRGGIVDEAALADALESGQIQGAAFEIEPPINSPLVGKNGMVLTPHIAASTKEAQARAGEELARIVIEFAKSSSMVQ